MVSINANFKGAFFFHGNIYPEIQSISLNVVTQLHKHCFESVDFVTTDLRSVSAFWINPITFYCLVENQLSEYSESGP